MASVFVTLMFAIHGMLIAQIMGECLMLSEYILVISGQKCPIIVKQ